MNLLALGLVLAAAVCHAVWNLIYKQASGGPAFVWLHSSVSAVLYAPLALGVAFWQHERLGVSAFLAILGSALLHAVYFAMLPKGYRIGDLSLIYPVSRGTGPALTAAAAMLRLGERPAAVALVGILLVVGSTFHLASPDIRGIPQAWCECDSSLALPSPSTLSGLSFRQADWVSHRSRSGS
jgi:drug/metabolite transporter (DMT)-like permease